MKEEHIKNKIPRREFLKLGGLGAAALASVKIAGEVQAIQGTAKGIKEIAVTKRWAMVIDLRRCYGCHACSVSCKSEANALLGNFRSWVNQVEFGEYPLAKRYFVPRLCNHCENPSCIKVCPTGATYKREDGVVMINKKRCIGCRYCIAGCPYGVRSFKWYRKEDVKDEMDWPARIYGVVDKCDFCFHRVDKGIEPACVNTCPAKARIFGDLNDPNSEVYRIVHKTPVEVLLSDMGTEPHVFYIGLHKEAAELAMKSGVRMTPVKA